MSTQYWNITGFIGPGLAALALSSVLVTLPARAAWTVVLKPDPLTRQSRCLALSEVRVTPDGYDSTPVTLVFNGVSLLAVTESELDPSFSDLKLVVDKEPPLFSQKLAHKNMTLVFDQDLPRLIQMLRTGRQAMVYLRFWPTWPVTESFAVPFNLLGFSKAFDALNQPCQPPAG